MLAYPLLRLQLDVQIEHWPYPNHLAVLSSRSVADLDLLAEYLVADDATSRARSQVA